MLAFGELRIPRLAARAAAPLRARHASGNAEPQSRHPDCWAAYGRFLFNAVRTRDSDRIVTCNDALLCFRRRLFGIDTSIVYAYQESESRQSDVWASATKAIETLTQHNRVDHLHLFVAGTVPPEDRAGENLRTLLGGRYTALAMPCETRDILELGSCLEDFLQSLGHSNRRHLKARHKEALESGMDFAISDDPAALGAQERFALALISRPKPYPRDLVDAFDAIALPKPGFFHASLRDASGALLSYCSGFIEADSLIVLYQFNHKNHPKQSLSMTLRSFLIHHFAGTRVKRIVFPLGMAGHLAHAATVNPISQILLVRRSFAAVAKALLISVLSLRSDAAAMVRTPGFFRHLLTGRQRAVGTKH